MRAGGQDERRNIKSHANGARMKWYTKIVTRTNWKSIDWLINFFMFNLICCKNSSIRIIYYVWLSVYYMRFYSIRVWRPCRRTMFEIGKKLAKTNFFKFIHVFFYILFVSTYVSGSSSIYLFFLISIFEQCTSLWI